MSADSWVSLVVGIAFGALVMLAGAVWFWHAHPKEVHVPVPPKFCQGVIVHPPTEERWTFCKMHPSWITEPAGKPWPTDDQLEGRRRGS